MKCRIGERTGNFVVCDSLGLVLNPDATRRGRAIEMSFFVTEDTAKRVQRRDEV